MARRKMTAEEREEYRRRQAEHCRQIGSLGGAKTAATYGPKFMSEIGKLGFAAACEKQGWTRAEGAAFLKFKREKHLRQPVGQCRLDEFAKYRREVGNG